MERSCLNASPRWLIIMGIIRRLLDSYLVCVCHACSVSLIQAPDLRDDMYLDALNSLLVSGEYPPLFSVDELDSLLQVMSD